MSLFRLVNTWRRWTSPFCPVVFSANQRRDKNVRSGCRLAMPKGWQMAALGTVTKMPDGGPTDQEYYVGLLDYWDHWETIDERLKPNHKHLSPISWTIGHDLVQM